MALLYLVPLGEIPPSVLDYLEKVLGDTYGYTVEAQRQVPVPGRSFDPTRRQYHSSLILGYLRKSAPTAADKILGVIDADLYAPGLNFVFGEADLKGCCAVISLARLHQEFYERPADSGLFFHRVAKEAVHEIGHTLGLGHCPHASCVMRFSSTVEDTDQKSSYLCATCARILAREKG